MSPPAEPTERAADWSDESLIDAKGYIADDNPDPTSDMHQLVGPIRYIRYIRYTSHIPFTRVTYRYRCSSGRIARNPAGYAPTRYGPLRPSPRRHALRDGRVDHVAKM